MVAGLLLLLVCAAFVLSRGGDEPTAPQAPAPPHTTTRTPETPRYKIEPTSPPVTTSIPEETPLPATSTSALPPVVNPDVDVEAEREDDHHPAPTRQRAPDEPAGDGRRGDGLGDGDIHIWRWIT